MNRLDIQHTSLSKRSGADWEFCATVGPRDGMTWRVMFPISTTYGYKAQPKFGGMMRRAMKQLRDVVVGGKTMPGYWGIYKV